MLFSCQYFKIRVREVLIIMMVLVLLFIGLKACGSNEDEKKEDKIEKVCTFTKENINELERLMRRADICSKGWFKDVEAYLTRLEEQRELIKKKNTKEHKAVLKLHNEVLNKLEGFREKKRTNH